MANVFPQKCTRTSEQEWDILGQDTRHADIGDKMSHLMSPTSKREKSVFSEISFFDTAASILFYCTDSRNKNLK